MYEHNALDYRSGLALCLTKFRSSRARCPATALILVILSDRMKYFVRQYEILLILSDRPALFAKTANDAVSPKIFVLLLFHDFSSVTFKLDIVVLYYCSL